MLFRSALKQYPLGREVLVAANTANITVQTVTVNNVNLSDEKVQVSDFDFANTIMQKEPTYCGDVVL